MTQPIAQLEAGDTSLPPCTYRVDVQSLPDLNRNRVLQEVLRVLKAHSPVHQTKFTNSRMQCVSTGEDWCDRARTSLRIALFEAYAWQTRSTLPILRCSSFVEVQASRSTACIRLAMSHSALIKSLPS
jgi:hypothetical protein